MMNFNVRTPTDEVQKKEFEKFLLINFQMLIKAQIDFMTRAKIGMSKIELESIANDVFEKYGIPLDNFEIKECL